MKKDRIFQNSLALGIILFLLMPPSLCFSAIEKITDNDGRYDDYPSLYNGDIAWMGDADGDYEIYFWNGSTTRRITTNTVQDGYPSLYNGTIAWQSNVDGVVNI